MYVEIKQISKVKIKQNNISTMHFYSTNKQKTPQKTSYRQAEIFHQSFNNFICKHSAAKLLHRLKKEHQRNLNQFSRISIK